MFNNLSPYDGDLQEICISGNANNLSKHSSFKVNIQNIAETELFIPTEKSQFCTLCSLRVAKVILIHSQIKRCLAHARTSKGKISAFKKEISF